MYYRLAKKIKSLSFVSILVVCGTLPFIVFPNFLEQTEFVKGFVFYFFVYFSFSFWILSHIVGGKVVIPKMPVLLALGSFIVLGFISTILSPVIKISFFGDGVSTDSFFTLLTCSIFIFLISLYAQEQKKLVSLFLTVFSSSIFTLLLQIILYSTRNLSFISNTVSAVSTEGTLVGTWTDFGYFAVYTAISGLLVYEILSPKKFFKFLSWFAIVGSLGTLICINSPFLWGTIAFAALLVFVYKSSVERTFDKQFLVTTTPSPENNKKDTTVFPVVSFAVLLISLFFCITTYSIGSSLSRLAAINIVDVRPSLSTSLTILSRSIEKNPLFGGVGPAGFSTAWDLFRPASVNQTPLWNTTFTTGFNYITSLVTTYGILPATAFIVVLLWGVVIGFKLFSYSFSDHFTRFIAVSSLILLITFISLLLVGSPRLAILVLGFTYLGFIFGVSRVGKKDFFITFEYLKDPRLSFFTILGLLSIGLMSFWAVYVTTSRFISVVVFTKAVRSSDKARTELLLNKAIKFSYEDAYWNAKALFYSNEFITNSQKNPVDQLTLQSLFTKAEQSAREAISINPSNAAHWLVLSRVYQLIATEKNPDASTIAYTTALEAQKRNPKNPLYDIEIATILIRDKKNTEALPFIEQALALKPDYLDAFILKGQLNESLGVSGALVSELNAYLSAYPFSAEGYQVLSDVYLRTKSYTEARTALENAQKISPSDSRVVLRLVYLYELLNEKEKAIELLLNSKKQFPSIEGIDEQINRIKSSTQVPTSSQ